MVVCSSPVAVTQTSDIVPVLSKEFLDIQTTMECGFTLKRVRDMTREYTLMILVYVVQPWFIEIFVSMLCRHQVTWGKNYNFFLS